MQRENFCIMIAVYEEGKGQLGFIYDVMRDELFGVDQKLGKSSLIKKKFQPLKISR